MTAEEQHVGLGATPIHDSHKHVVASLESLRSNESNVSHSTFCQLVLPALRVEARQLSN